MKIIDSQGKLLGKLSILDLGAGFVLLFAIAAIFFANPISSNISAQAKLQPIKIEVLVRGLSVVDFGGLVKDFEDGDVSIVIRNQPAGTVKINSTKLLPRTIPVPQPDGSVKALPDPRPEVASIRDFIVTLAGKAEVTNDGVILEGAKKLKIGSTLRLEGKTYDFNGTTISISPQAS